MMLFAADIKKGENRGTKMSIKLSWVYYESRNREIWTRPIYEFRYDERLKTKSEKSTRLAYTGLLGELEHLKIETINLVSIIEDVFCVGNYASVYLIQNKKGRRPKGRKNVTLKL